MSDLLEIANMALSEVAEQDIVTIDDAAAPAKHCRRHIYQAIREVLASGTWKCARQPAYNLGQLTDSPDFGWEYAYQLPVDYVRMYTFNEVTTEERWEEMFEVQGKTLLTDESTVSIVYIKDLTAPANDLSAMPPLMVRACYLNLASKIAWPLQQSRTLKEKLEDSAEKALKKALAVDAREEFRALQNPAAGSRWLPSRYVAGGD
jgi:hypothetical protein